MTTRLRLLASSLLAGALCAPVALSAGPLLPPAGVPSSTMKPLDQIDPAVIIESLPFVITEPGRYALRSSLDCPPGVSAVVVLASDVVIDGGGFSLNGAGAGVHGVFVEGSQSGVHIKDVIIEAFTGNGVHAPDAEVACRSVVCRGNTGSGFVLNVATLEDCDGLDNGGDGCDINASRPGRGHVTLIKGCDFSGNVGTGLRVADGDGTDCDDVRANDNGGDGFDLQGKSGGTRTGHVTLMKRCDARGNIGVGLRVAETDRLACDDSTFSGNEQEGARVFGRTGHVTLMKRCDVSNNTGAGLFIVDADRLVCEDSSFMGQGGDGVHVQGRNGHVTLMKRCDSSNNAGAGLRLSRGNGDCDDSIFSGNGQQGVVALLGEGPVSGPPVQESLSLAGCTLESNAGRGLDVSPGGTGASLALRVRSTNIGSSGQDGVVVECPDGAVSSSVHIESSSIHDNAGSGLYLLPGVDNDCDSEIVDSSLSRNNLHGVRVAGGSSTDLDFSLSLHGTTCSSTEVDGVHVDLAATTGRSSVDASSLVCDSNGGDGLAYSSGGGAGKATFKEFTVTRNGVSGARLVPGPGDGTDGLPPSSLEVIVASGEASGNLENGINVGSASTGAGAGKANFQDFHFRSNAGSGLSSTAPVTAESCDFTGNGANGVVVEARRELQGHVTLIKRCAATNNEESGIRVSTSEPQAGVDLHLVDTVASSNGLQGVHVTCDSATALMAVACTGLHASSNLANGMLVVPVAMDKGLRFSASSSSFSGNGQSGFQTGPDRLAVCDISSSEATGNAGTGLLIECDAVHLASNNIGSNGQDGIYLAGAAGGVVRDNTCAGNAGRGIAINTSHVEYATNRCASNGEAGIEVVGGFGNMIADSFVSGNAAPGIVLNSSENRLHGNSSGLSAGFIFTPDPAVFNDIAPQNPASIGGDTNVGF